MQQFAKRLIILCGMSLTTLVAANQMVMPIARPFMRLEGHASQLRVSPNGLYLAFTDINGQDLSILEISSQKVLNISKNLVGSAFFWAPDGIRLFYRAMFKSAASKNIVSEVRAYDCRRSKDIAIDQFAARTGILSYDPRDLRMHFLSEKGLHSKKLYFPDQRLAEWQIAQRTEHGKWIIAQNGIVWATDGGYSLRRMDDDQSAVQSFDISPDGASILWATTAGIVYLSKNGEVPTKIGFGLDPRWHPFQNFFVYASAQRVGNKTISYDLRIVDIGQSNMPSKYLTQTQDQNERWPTWHPNGKEIYFTKEQSTDLYAIDFKPQQ